MSALYGGLLGAALGSIPFAWVVHRAVTGRDLRAEGSGNPGAANVQRTAGTGWGLLALALDAGKAALAVGLSSRAWGASAALAAAAASVAAHIASPWLAGRGGKGVAPAAGAFAVATPAATSVACLVFAVVVLATRWVSLASVSAAIVLPLAAALTGAPRALVLTAAAVAVAIAWRHRENFARMRRGTEPRAGRGSRPGGSGEP